jgi:hypothetical protein
MNKLGGRLYGGGGGRGGGGAVGAWCGGADIEASGAPPSIR